MCPEFQPILLFGWLGPNLGPTRNLGARHIMLDPRFKALLIMANLVGHENAIRLAFEYDVKVVVPLLTICFDRLNPVASTFAIVAINVTWPKLEANMFRVGASIEDSSWSSVTGEWPLFKKKIIPSYACEDPLAWRLMHEGTTRNLPFCNCLMQLVFSCMRHLQLEIRPVA